VRRLGGARTPIPFASVLEERYRIDTGTITATLQAMCEHVRA
jgi:hypothetical protein